MNFLNVDIIAFFEVGRLYLFGFFIRIKRINMGKTRVTKNEMKRFFISRGVMTMVII
jgi:hypothetical protein